MLICAMLVSGPVPMAALPVPQAVESVTPSHSVKPGAHCIVIELGGESPLVVTVFALTGQIVRQLEVEPGITRLDMPPGYYIVRVDGLSQRVVVR